MKLAFVLPNLSGGGAARVATILCNAWQASGEDVHLITFENSGAVPAYPVDDLIVRHQIGLERSPRNQVGMAINNLCRIATLRSELSRIKPSAVVSFLLESNVVAVLAARSAGIPVLISERNHPEHHKIAKAKLLMRKIVYPRATRLCVQTEDIRQWFLSNLGIDSAVIPNPLAATTSVGAVSGVTGTPNGRRKRMVSLGRLEPQKGADRLIDAFALVAHAVADWDLVIFGEGEQRADLEARIERHGLIDRITLPGVTSQPELELRVADLYVHPARYEGYPNAVIEALSAGLCVVATDCPGATRQILQGGEFGILVPNTDAQELATGIVEAVSDADRRHTFAAKAQLAVECLSAPAIAERWLSEVRLVSEV